MTATAAPLLAALRELVERADADCDYLANADTFWSAAIERDAAGGTALAMALGHRDTIRRCLPDLQQNAYRLRSRLAELSERGGR